MAPWVQSDTDKRRTRKTGSNFNKGKKNGPNGIICPRITIARKLRKLKVGSWKGTRLDIWAFKYQNIKLGTPFSIGVKGKGGGSLPLALKQPLLS